MRKCFIIILAAANLLAGVWLWQAAQPHQLKVAFLDVGQGDAIYIEAPNGNQVLIDGGSGRQVLRALGGVMPWNDRSLDLVIATHPDADHIGGLPAVLERFQVAGVMNNGQTSETSYDRAWQAAASAARAGGAEAITARRGERIILDQNQKIYLDILWPINGSRRRNTNDNSVVARLAFGAESFLLTGDAPVKVENELLALNPSQIKTTVLKVGHHGSKNSSGAAFIKAVSPIYAIISVGARNRYGHPNQSVLDTLAAASSTVFRTDEQGTIVCETDSTVTNCSPQT